MIGPPEPVTLELFIHDSWGIAASVARVDIGSPEWTSLPGNL
jgi:hypothetical protein